jgi:transposase
MEEKQLLLRAEINGEEWEKTPPSVRRAFVRLMKELEALKEQEKKLSEENQGLQEKANRNSQNSHSPPSSQTVKPVEKEEKKNIGKKRGGQPGHLGYSRYLYPLEACELVRDYQPSKCSCCGEALRGSDPNTYRHQIVEVPPIEPRIEEHRLHQLECEKCGQKNRAKLPEEVERSGYGARLVSMVAVLGGVHHLSHRQIMAAMSDLFRVC